jgi:hypothetical protein
MPKHLKTEHLAIGTIVWMVVRGETRAAKAVVVGWDPYQNPRRCCVKLRFDRLDLGGPHGFRVLCHEAFDEALARIGP